MTQESLLQRQSGESETDFFDRCEDHAGRGPIDAVAFYAAAAAVMRAIIDEAAETVSAIMSDVIGPVAFGASSSFGENTIDQHLSASTQRGFVVTVRLLLSVIATRGTKPTREELAYTLALSVQQRKEREYCGDFVYWKEVIAKQPDRIDPEAFRSRLRKAAGLK